MKLLIAIMLWLLPVVASAGTITVGQPAAAAGACTLRFSDDFNRASIGANWSDIEGTTSIVSNAAHNATSGGIALCATSFTGVTQWARMKILGYMGGIYVRANLASPAYVVAFGSVIAWADYNGNILDQEDIGETVSGDIMSALIKGTGTGTRVSIWKNTSNATPYSAGAACTDTSKPCWDNAGDAPDAILSAASIASPANSDLAFALKFYSSVDLDDVSMGDCSD